MKNSIGLCFALFTIANSLMAWGYYNEYDGSYPYTGWRWPSSYSDGCPQKSGQFSRKIAETKPKASRPQYPQQSQRSGKSLEQQYAKLIVMFTKDGCGYCRYMKPIMKQVEKQFGKNIKFLYADIDQNPQYPSQYGFSTVPHIVYFKDGKKLDSHGSGDKTMTVEQVEEKIENAFGDNPTDD